MPLRSLCSFPSPRIGVTALLVSGVVLTSAFVVIPSARGAPTRSGAVATGTSDRRADSLTARRAVESFRESVARGDSAAALAQLAPDVVVLESGDVERYAAYRSHHLGADIAFSRAVPSRHTVVSVEVLGDVAWVASTSVTQGQFSGRAVNSAGAELIVLSRASARAPWRIRAIHWSSHKRQG